MMMKYRFSMRSISNASITLIAVCMLMLPAKATATPPAIQTMSPLNQTQYQHLAGKLSQYNVTSIEIVTTLTPNNLRPLQPAIQNASGSQARAIESISGLLSFVTLIPGMDLNHSRAQNVACISLPGRWATNRVDISMGSGGDSDSFYLLEVKLSNQCTARGVLQLKLRTDSGPEETIQEITLSSGTPEQYLWSNPISAGTPRHLTFRLANSWRTRDSDIKRLVSFGFKHTRLYRITVGSSDDGGISQPPTGSFQPQPGASTPQLPSGSYQPAPSGGDSGGSNLPSGTYQPTPSGSSGGSNLPRGSLIPAPSNGGLGGSNLPSGTFQPAPSGGGSGGSNLPQGSLIPRPSGDGSSGSNLPSGTYQPVPSGSGSTGPGLPSGTLQPIPSSGGSGPGKGSCKSHAQCNDGDPCTQDLCVAGKCKYRPSTSSRCVDRDKDGYPASQDCNDRNPKVFPGAKEICGDRIDNDCDRKVDEGCKKKSGAAQSDHGKNRYNGQYAGVVVRDNDPQHQGRVLVKIPSVLGKDKTIWAKPASKLAKNNRGQFAVPEVGSRVQISFERGDLRNPVWKAPAGVWNKPDEAPASDNQAVPPRKTTQKSALQEKREKEKAQREKAEAEKAERDKKRKERIEQQETATAKYDREKKERIEQRKQEAEAQRKKAEAEKAERDRERKARSAERQQLKQ